MGPATVDPADTQRSALSPPIRPASRLRVYSALALGIVCIAFSAIFVRWAGVPGTVSAFYRVAIAALVLSLPFARGLARGGVVRDRRIWLLAAGAGVFFALDIALWNTSLFLTTAANATLLGNDAPIIVGLGALLLFHERLNRSYWLGLALALVGMGVIIGFDVLSRTSLGGGDLLALAGGASYGLYLLATQRIRARMDTLSSLWIAGVVGAVLLLPVNLIAQRALWGFSTRAYLALLGLALISQVAGWLAINYALGHLPASIVSVTLLAQPVMTAFLAVPLLGEPLAPRQLLGGALALAGIYLVNRGATRPAPRVPGPV
jgi:drug/metabolite transporter (DMT)-like permease